MHQNLKAFLLLFFATTAMAMPPKKPAAPPPPAAPAPPTAMEIMDAFHERFRDWTHSLGTQERLLVETLEIYRRYRITQTSIFFGSGFETPESYEEARARMQRLMDTFESDRLFEKLSTITAFYWAHWMLLTGPIHRLHPFLRLYLQRRMSFLENPHHLELYEELLDMQDIIENRNSPTIALRNPVLLARALLDELERLEEQPLAENRRNQIMARVNNLLTQRGMNAVDRRLIEARLYALWRKKVESSDLLKQTPKKPPGDDDDHDKDDYEDKVRHHSLALAKKTSSSSANGASSSSLNPTRPTSTPGCSNPRARFFSEKMAHF